MKARKFRKRTLVALILLINGILVLVLVHMNKAPKEDRADIGQLQWLSSKRPLTEALESLQDIKFSEAIRKQELKSKDVKNHGDMVDIILNRVNFEARMLLFVYPRKLKDVESYDFPNLVEKGAISDTEYVEGLTKLLIRRVESGEVEYPIGNRETRKYIKSVKSIVEKFVNEVTDTEAVTLTSKKFPDIKISFYTYVALILLNIRERIVKDFDLIRELFELETMTYRTKNSEILEFAKFFEISRAAYNSANDDSRERCCEMCTLSSRSDNVELLMTPSGRIICSYCSRNYFFLKQDDPVAYIY